MMIGLGGLKMWGLAGFLVIFSTECQHTLVMSTFNLQLLNTKCINPRPSKNGSNRIIMGPEDILNACVSVAARCLALQGQLMNMA